MAYGADIDILFEPLIARITALEERPVQTADSAKELLDRICQGYATDAAPGTLPGTTPPPETKPETKPEPVALPAGYKAVQAHGIDKTQSINWKDPKISIYLPTWVGGDQGNGVGGSFGAPYNVLYNDDGSVDLKAGMELSEGKWRTGWLQFNKPLKAKGKWGAIITSHTANAVNAFFTYADNSKELDFELVRRNGVVGWAPAVHMHKTGGGRASSNKRLLALGEFKPGVPQRLEVELFDDRAVFSIDGKVFETVKPADMAAGAIWDTTTNMAVMTTIERHAGWAGWTAEDYAKQNRMTVHALLP